MVFHANKAKDENTIKVWTEDGCFSLPEQADEIFDNKAPFFEEMVQDFLNACRKENCGDILVCGWDGKNKEYYTYAIENGSHGGITTDETEGFACIPKHTPVAGMEKGYLRPLDLRTSAFNLLEGYREKYDNKFIQCSYKKDTLKVMTYNVHGCVGMDGKLSPSRISEVISQYEPDIVALQELDVGRQRSGKEDQAMLIAEYLNMDHHFHASLQLAKESFGDAILSSYPMQLIKKDALSRNSNFYFLEPRGALWVEVNYNSQPIQIINTHLGLNSKERLLHAKELIDTKWLSHPECKGAVILCGDFNALPSSRVFKVFNSSLSSVQTKKGKMKYKGTWFGRHPVACLDHIFISTNIEVVKVEVCDSHLARLASDHRPFLAEIKICGTN